MDDAGNWNGRVTGIPRRSGDHSWFGQNGLCGTYRTMLFQEKVTHLTATFAGVTSWRNVEVP